MTEIIITNEHVGGFLILEGLISLLFAPNKCLLPQAARLVRIGIGGYIYDKVQFKQEI